MNYRRLALSMITLSFILIVSGGVSSFVLGLKRDKEEIYKRINEVNDEFEVFSTNTSVFESKRDELHNEVLNNIYYDTMYDEDKNVKNTLSNYEHLVDELTKNTKKLNGLCEDVYYPDSKANAKCNNYKSIYEQVVNYFVSDISVYNSNVSKYNEYQKGNNSDLRVDKYKTKKDYIDYNNDKVYDGKEE
ncbi:MAG: hypothetical protein IJ097_01650 [Bacilli bacterium]|nr:hypothetical protein [Bacilli bacterium]